VYGSMSCGFQRLGRRRLVVDCWAFMQLIWPNQTAEMGGGLNR
jgi:hypothetical protein